VIGWRGRIGFLVPPGNPTMEPEMIGLTPRGVAIYFTRMVAHGVTGSHEGQDDRNRTQIKHLDENTDLLAMVKPQVLVLGHTATSYTLGRQGEQELVERMQARHGVPFITAFGSVVQALTHLGIRRVAYATPYNAQTTLQGKAHLQTYGFEVAAFGHLAGVTNIYDETPERAYALGRQVDVAEAEAVFLSGVGMPTIEAIDALEQDLGKPVISSASAMMWNALRLLGVKEPVPGAGRLLRGASSKEAA
jgi:maleate cis-trans isomerase